jgi:tetratricopeptide (TPR) repeat protein
MVWVGVAKLHLNADTEAVAWLRRGLEANRNYSLAHFHLAAALALLGELDEARAAVQAGLALDPNFTIRRLRASSAWTIRLSLPDANAQLRACAWPGCQKGKSEPAAAPRDLQHSPKSPVIAGSMQNLLPLVAGEEANTPPLRQ